MLVAVIDAPKVSLEDLILKDYAFKNRYEKKYYDVFNGTLYVKSKQVLEYHIK